MSETNETNETLNLESNMSTTTKRGPGTKAEQIARLGAACGKEGREFAAALVANNSADVLRLAAKLIPSAVTEITLSARELEIVACMPLDRQEAFAAEMLAGKIAARKARG